MSRTKKATAPLAPVPRGYERIWIVTPNGWVGATLVFREEARARAWAYNVGAAADHVTPLDVPKGVLP